MNIWLIVGIGLILWTCWDLFTGRSWFIDRMYARRSEPLMYWVSWTTWFTVAIITTIGSM